MVFLRSLLNLVLLLSLSQFISLTKSENETASVRVVGGDNIYEPIPYQISFQRVVNNQWRHFCSGSIISPDFFITAAHCVKGTDVALMSVLAGVTNLKSNYGSRHYVQGYKWHEGYVPVTTCDIAIVKVYPPFELNTMTVDAISFTDPTPVSGGTSVVLTGWGSIDQNGRNPLPDNLQVLTTSTMYNSDCQKAFPQLKCTELCTFRATAYGACNGDSGGPLVDYGRTKLIGVVAFGSRPCANGYPDFFTRISEFIGWIQARMAEPWV